MYLFQLPLAQHMISKLESTDSVPCVDRSYSKPKAPNCETLQFYVQKLLRNCRIYQTKEMLSAEL